MSKSTNQNTGKTQRTYTQKTLQELFLKSGNLCAMPDCNQRIIVPDSQGYVGKVAHIVGASENGPRGSDPLPMDERNKYDNLLLLCSNHATEIDDSAKGEKEYPVERLRKIKQLHEERIGQIIQSAIEEEVAKIKSGSGVVDTQFRHSGPARNAQELLRHYDLIDELDENESQEAVKFLNEMKEHLQRLSQLALDVLSSILRIWRDSCRQRDGSFDFYKDHPQEKLGYVLIENRVKNITRFCEGLEELRERDFIEIVKDDEDEQKRYLIISHPMRKTTSHGLHENLWAGMADFLHNKHTCNIADWVCELDFSVFDGDKK